ncbi:hypothetical protein EJB05_01435 [Eragrostis curvula]|uniref:Dof zinc finger protein n=1 Tax=Eragrostis curvula TaxID=38414 RepID=A0A5J9WPI5_9POAL|nr:hypothetical protein EJB05_01435 [Eragrostis curvula]
MDMMTSNSKASSSTATGSTHHQRQLEFKGTAPQVVEARNVKLARKQAAVSAGAERKPRPQLDEALRCPRCDSSKTKFCYYNNYSMKQPRYFCKACRRYWTQGGSLRNVPIGGGCHKNKRGSPSFLPPSSSSSSSSSINEQLHQHLAPASSAEDFPNVLPTFWEDFMEENTAPLLDVTSSDLLPLTSDMQDLEGFSYESYLLDDMSPTQAQAEDTNKSSKAPM